MLVQLSLKIRYLIVMLSLLKILMRVVRRMLETHALIANKSEAKEESYLMQTMGRDLRKSKYQTHMD